MHLVGPNRVDEVMDVSIVSVHSRQLSSNEVPLFICIPDEEKKWRLEGHNNKFNREFF